MSIRHWPETERPREKLLNRGAQHLSDAELLAIFLRTGYAGKSAVDLARELIEHFGSLRALFEADQDSFCRVHGLGTAKYAQLQAVLEMANRHLAEAITRECVLNSSSKVRSYLKAKLRHQRREVFAVMFLDSQNRLIAYEELFLGTINAASVYPREIVGKALQHNAAAVIFAHNHPSGVAEPSRSDEVLTSTLVQALNLIDIKTLDHFIVGEDELYSFAEHGKLHGSRLG